MSLYNALFGTNPYANALLMVLGTTSGNVPRFRDCYLNDDGKIVIFTRTGGGNREDYDSENEALHNLPGFISDEDDDFDCTYAKFTYEPPQDLADVLAEIAEKQGHKDPMGAFNKLIADLQSDIDTPEVRRAKEVGEKIFGAVEDGEKEIKV